MTTFKTNIIIKPESGPFETACGVFIAAFIFIPFTLGFILETKWLFLSLPAGVVLMLFYNLATNGKFNPKNWIQKDYFIEFNHTGIRIGSNAQQKEYLWSAMTGTDLRVEGFDGESKGNSEDSAHDGQGNKIIFTADGTKHEIYFYLKNAAQKESLKEFLWDKTLVAEMDLSVKDQGTPLEIDLKGFQRTRPEQEALAAEKRKAPMGCLYAFLTPFVLVGIGTLVLFFYQLWMVYQASSWKPIPANVVHFDIVYSSSGESTSSKVEISYSYSVGNTLYTGDRFSFNVGSTNVENNGKLSSILENAKVIQVYVDEDDPEDSVVVRGLTNGIIFMGIFSLMWNSLLVIFLLPLIGKKIEAKKIIVFVVVVWVLGIGKFITGVGDVDTSKGVVVIESKGNVE